jgi:uncharacterized protein
VTGDAAEPGPRRDRDTAGRARNSRPRDELGRPLPHGASADVPRIPDDLTISPDEAAVLGGSLLAEGRPFHAHEVFEAAWKTGLPAERDLWQGLAQVAVGITHARRGNGVGAVTLLRRGARRVSAFRNSRNDLYGIDPAFVADRAEEIAARIESSGLDAVPEADLLLPLAPPAPPAT